MSKTVELDIAREGATISLRTANEDDLSDLRQWKNAEREFFFFKGEISPEQQVAWFRAYQQRPEDFMFIVRVDDVAVGCMGIRKVDGVWDVYNVILGHKDYGGRGVMGKAFQAMLRFATTRSASPITLQVLKCNPAVGWYQKNAFLIVSEQPDHYCMTYQPETSVKDAP